MGCGASALAEPVGAAVETVGAAVETIARTTRIEAAEAGATTATKHMSRLTHSIKCERARRDGGGAHRTGCRRRSFGNPGRALHTI